MKNQKGVTMASLVTSIIVLVILASVATYAGLQAYSDAKVEAFVNKMKVVQKKVDLISQEYLTWNGLGGNDLSSSNNTFAKYLASLGFTKLNDSSISGNSHVTALKKIITDNKAKYQGIDASEYYYFDPSLLKSRLGIDNLSDSKFYVAIYFANPTDIYKKNFVIEETGVKIKSGNTNKAYYEYYSINN